MLSGVAMATPSSLPTIAFKRDRNLRSALTGECRAENYAFLVTKGGPKLPFLAEGEDPSGRRGLKARERKCCVVEKKLDENPVAEAAGPGPCRLEGEPSAVPRLIGEANGSALQAPSPERLGSTGEEDSPSGYRSRRCRPPRAPLRGAARWKERPLGELRRSGSGEEASIGKEARAL